MHLNDPKAIPHLLVHGNTVFHETGLPKFHKVPSILICAKLISISAVL